MELQARTYHNFRFLFQQFGLLCFNMVRGPGTTKDGSIINARAIVSISFIVIYSLIFIGSFFWQQFKGISPIQVIFFICSLNSESQELHDIF
jgi:hypothetical protein